MNNVKHTPTDPNFRHLDGDIGEALIAAGWRWSGLTLAMTHLVALL